MSDFLRLVEGLFDLRVCTSLSDEEATARARAEPCGTEHGWQLNMKPGYAPVPCAQLPATHRHLMFEC